MAKRKPLGEASIPPTMIIPLVGVVVAVGVAAVVIKSVPRAKVTDRSLRAGQKL